MSAVINLTNHLQLSPVPWYVPFEATLQALLGVAHPIDLVHKHRIISPNYPVVIIIHQPPTPAAYSSFPALTYIAFRRRDSGFSSAGQSGI